MIFLLKTNKSPGYDNLQVNVIRNLYKEIKTSLMNIFNLLLTTGIFPDRTKVAKVTPIFKKAEKCTISNYRPISVLLCFSKILEQIMYNKLYHYFTVSTFYLINNLDFELVIQMSMLF